MKRLPLLLTAALMVLLAACSQPPASPELEGQWSGSADAGAAAIPMSFEVEPGGHVYAHSFQIEYGGETLAVDVDSHATGKSISITVLAVHSNGDRLEFELNGEVNGDTLSGDYRLKLTVNGESSQLSGDFTLTREQS